MSKKEIDIDFTKSHNRIILLVGKNGSGKTSILSNLHPFPHVGTLDLRNTQNLIREGMDGEKIFECEDGENKYKVVIKYIWTKNTHKCLAFIRKNIEELNPSGGLFSFYKIIKFELDIDPSFLKILRLGPNVTDIITLRAAERKEFVGALLSDVEIYQALYKRANEESKLAKNNLKILSSKFDQIGTFENLGQKLKEVEKIILDLENEKSKLTQDYYTEKGKLESQLMKDEEVERVIQKYEEVEDLIRTINKIDLKTTQSFKEEFLANREYLQKISVEKSNLEYQLKTKKDILIKTQEKINDYQNKYDMLKEHDSVEIITDQINQYLEEIEQLKAGKGLYYSTKVYKHINDTFVNIGNLFRKMYDYPDGPIRYIISIAKGKDKDGFFKAINKHISRDIEDTQNKLLAVGIDISNLLDEKIFYVPGGCEIYDTCPFFKSISSICDNQSHKKEKRILEDKLGLLHQAKEIYDTLFYINSIIDDLYKDLTNIEPEVKIDFMKIVVALGNLSLIQYEDILNITQEYLSRSEEIDRCAQLSNEVDKLINERERVKTTGSLATIEELLSHLIEEQSTLENEIDQLQSNLDKVQSTFDICQENVDRAQKDYDNILEYEAKSNKIESIKNKYKNALVSNNAKALIDVHSKTFEESVQRLETSLKESNDERNSILFKIQEKKNIKKEKDEIESNFEFIEIVKEAISSTKGIPLIFIQLYLRNIQITANKIIHEMFDESISLENFIITEKEFCIPYTINGITIKDVSYSSQGERTTFIIALSFAILQQFMTRYNVLLLDEMDGPLYRGKKEKFIQIIEAEMDRMGADQIFMITHNNLFENYPVDLICTSKMDVNEYNKSHVIWSV